jgi:DNA-binding Xre family transcriptional regulator
MLTVHDVLVIRYCFCFVYEIVLELQETYTSGMVEVNVDRLKVLRHQRLLTLRELEQRSGVAYNTIWHLENGKRGAQPRTLRKLARALDVEPEELVKTEG